MHLHGWAQVASLWYSVARYPEASFPSRRSKQLTGGCVQLKLFDSFLHINDKHEIQYYYGLTESCILNVFTGPCSSVPIPRGCHQKLAIFELIYRPTKVNSMKLAAELSILSFTAMILLILVNFGILSTLRLYVQLY